MSQPDSEQQAALVEQFVVIAGIDRDRARFYLESANFDLSLALSAFYEGGIDEDEPEVLFDRGNEAEDVQIVDEAPDEEDIAFEHDESTKKMSASGGGKSGESDDKKKKKFATLSSLGKSGGPSNRDESSDDDSEKGQAFYVGGSEKSGQQVLGPPKKKANDIPERFFQEAQERGAEQIDATQRAGASASAGGGQRGGTFGGAGYRLGDTVKPSEKIGGLKGDEEDESEESDPTNNVTVVMRMYQDGFTINDEPVRGFDTPANRQFLDHIMNGRLPPELIQAHRGKKIDLEMEDHRHEEYKAQKRPMKAFSGQGHTLGSPVPQVLGAGKVGEKAPAPAPAAAAAAAASSASASSNTPVVNLPIDESKPITNIQVRLGNGERLAMKLNHSHTVKELREFLCQLRPDLCGRAFVLMTSFPSQELTNESVTLEEAKLLNAVIIQRFK